MKQVNNLIGKVISAGRMNKAVKVETTKRNYNKFFKTHFMVHPRYLVSDPKNSLRMGDTIKFEPWKSQTSDRIKHVVTEIVAPFWPPLDQRPPVPTEEERRAELGEKRRRRRVAKAASKEEQALASATAESGEEGTV